MTLIFYTLSNYIGQECSCHVMTLHELTLKNFKQYGAESIQFKQELVGITGRNGSGKSSVFEAILLALYGSFEVDNKYLRSSWASTKDAVIVNLEFEIGERRYRVERQFRGKSLAHHADLYDITEGLENHIATSANEVKRRVTDLLGMDKEAFTKSVFSGQKELDEISKVQGGKRREMIRKMVGLDKLDTIQKLIRRDANQLKSEIAGQRALLLNEQEFLRLEKESKGFIEKEGKQKELCASIEQELKTKNEVYQKTKTELDGQQKLRDVFNKLDKDLSKFFGAIERFKESLKKQEGEQLNLEALKKELDKQTPEVQLFASKKLQKEHSEKEKKRHDRVVLLKQQRAEKLTLSERIIQAIEQAEKEIEPIEKLKKEVEELEKKHTVQETIEHECMKKSRDLFQKIGGIKTKIGERQENIATMQELGKDADCPTCLRPLVESYDATLTKLNSEIEAYQNKELKTLETELEKNRKAHDEAIELRRKLAGHITKRKNEQSAIQTKLKEIGRQKSSLEGLKSEVNEIEKNIKSVGEIRFDEHKYEALIAEIKSFEPIYINYEKGLSKMEQLPKIKAEITTLTKRISDGNEHLKLVEKEIETLNFSMPAYEAAHQKREAAEAERDAAQSSLTRERTTLNDINNHIKKIRHRLDTHAKTQAAIRDREHKFIQLEELSGVFGRFKNDILEKVRPTIAGKAGDLFRTITRHRYEGIHIDDNFNFEILDDGKYYPIERFSGGEIDLANLCLRIGISEAVAQLAGSKNTLGFLGFDEVFGSQDDERRRDIMHALQILKQQYKQIYIVTHINDVKEEFSEILEIRRTPNGSQAKWLA